jgi:hypothetical protein
MTDADRLERARNLYIVTVTRPEFDALTVAMQRRDETVGSTYYNRNFWVERCAVYAAELHAARELAGKRFDAEVNQS